MGTRALRMIFCPGKEPVEVAPVTCERGDGLPVTMFCHEN